MAWPFDSEEQLDEWADLFVNTYAVQSKDEGVTEEEYRVNEPSMLAIHQGHAEALWRFILKVLERQPSAWAAEVLAAGPLEDLIAQAGPQFIDRIEEQARHAPVFREALLYVWRNASTQDIWDRVVRARGMDSTLMH